MNKFNHIFISAVAILAFIGLSTSADAAFVKYTYTGNSFDNLPVSSNSHVSIEFIIDDSLVPKNGRFELSAPNSVPASFSVTGGNIIIDSTPDPYIPSGRGGEVLSRLTFDTDIEGNVNGAWWVSAYSWMAAPCEGCYSQLEIESAFNIQSYPNQDRVDYYLVANNNPGTWARTSTTILPTVPLPGSALLFGSALGGLCFNRRLFWRGVLRGPRFVTPSRTF